MHQGTLPIVPRDDARIEWFSRPDMLSGSVSGFVLDALWLVFDRTSLGRMPNSSNMVCTGRIVIEERQFLDLIFLAVESPYLIISILSIIRK